MKRLWLVLNTGSGSTSAAIIAAFEKACSGFDIVGRTDFPDRPPPDAATLEAKGCDTLVVFGGDGTINAATCGIDDWAGQCLVLPGGTMNGLAKALHGNLGWAEVLKRAPTAPMIRVPVAQAGRHRAMVGVILGPASSWFHARERVREGAYAKLGRALVYAARKTFARTITIVGDSDDRHRGGADSPNRGGAADRHRAVIVTPEADGLEVASISTANWFAAARLGWNWLLGDWRQADGVAVRHVHAVELTSRRPVSALFDGEPCKLPSPVRLEHALTGLRFIATRDG